MLLLNDSNIRIINHILNTCITGKYYVSLYYHKTRKTRYEILLQFAKIGVIFFNSCFMTDVIINAILSPQEYAILALIREQREQLKKQNPKGGEPLLTLQQNYIVALLHQSYTTVTNALDRLTELGVISVVDNYFGECKIYQYNESGYKSLLQKAIATKVTLYTGRNKTPKEVSARQVLRYMTGKSIEKARNSAIKRNFPSK